MNDLYIGFGDLPCRAINDPYTRNAAFCDGIPSISLQSYNANQAKNATYSKNLNAILALSYNAIIIAITALNSNPRCNL